MSAANESTRDDQEHTALRQGRERAELLHRWQRCGTGELCEPLERPHLSKSNINVSSSSLIVRLLAC